ncbi:MAG: hypothetical protein V3V16_15310 [Melioribacteraceae bacterium]
MKIKILILNIVVITFFGQSTFVHSQVQGTEKRYVRIGSLQSHFSAYGSERAWNNSYYEGLKWPADYPFQDNSVIKRSWIAIEDFTDSKKKHWEKYGIYFAQDYVGQSLFPVELKQTAKFEAPAIYVNGNNISSRYKVDVDEYNPNQIPDRIVTNIVNTNIGLTIKREILAFSQQYHDNYFIKVFTYTNTGNTDYDDEIEITTPIKGLRIGWGTRYSVSRDGASSIGGAQKWGQFSWVTKRGENYSEHQNEIIDEENPIVDWLRCGFSWAGQSSTNSFDNIGGPDTKGSGRFMAPQHAGAVVLHVDKSAVDSLDDDNQPVVLGWHAGDTYPSLGDMSNVTPMIQLYRMLTGIPHQGLGGTDKFYESNINSITHKLDPSTIHNDGGGTNLWVTYGSFNLEHGESVVIVEAEGVNGLSRQVCETLGRRWKDAFDNSDDKGPFTLPDNSTTANKDVFKNTWVYTGVDSILQTFGRAKRNFDSGFEIPQAPQPPTLFEVKSGGDRISLVWSASPSEPESNFSGYKIFRAIGKPDTVFEEIYSAKIGENSFDDVTAVRGFAYYYYISSFTDGSKNTTGATNPTGELYSSRLYTKTTEPTFLSRKAGESLNSIRVVPNPYSIRLSRDLQFTGEPDKIMFLDIPGYCTIKIYTERGDLVDEIIHDNGSGDQAWNSLTLSRQVITSGVYLALITVSQDYNDPDTGELKYKKGDTAVRKFIVIR